MKSLVRLASAAVLALSATFASAEDLIVATDTAFVPFEFKEGDKYVASISTCGTRSPRNLA